MPDRTSERLAQLPVVPRPQGRYVAAVVHAGIAYSAGMTPRSDGVLSRHGIVGATISTEEARALAHEAATNALAAIAHAAGGIAEIVRCLRMTVYVAATADFAEHSTVADGASAALHAQLGERGDVARAAVGVSSLPSGAPIEVDLVAAVRMTP